MSTGCLGGGGDETLPLIHISGHAPAWPILWQLSFMFTADIARNRVVWL